MSKLVVAGEVERPLELDAAALARLPGQVDDVSRLVPGREGSGVRLGDVLAAARTRAGATHVTLRSSDGRFAASSPIAAVRDGIVVYRLGDGPLPAASGGPIRFLLPRSAGCDDADATACANVKQLGEVRVTRGAEADTRPRSAGEHAKLHE
jgi:DMSO/TMAO reductase YedYZ molybdopterin-dependent catalytic subunit